MRDRSNRGYDVLGDLVSSGQVAVNEEKTGYYFTDPSKPMQLSGSGNYAPRQEYADKLFAMSDEEFLKQCEQAIWLAAYAANNPVSDYHWQCDACYLEARRRGKQELYEEAWHNASGL